jgi:hypothetical protein
MNGFFGRVNRSTRRIPAPMSLRQPQIPNGLTWARTQAAAVGSQRLTSLSYDTAAAELSVRIAATCAATVTKKQNLCLCFHAKWALFSKCYHWTLKNYTITMSCCLQTLSMTLLACYTRLLPQMRCDSSPQATWTVGILAYGRWKIPMQPTELPYILSIAQHVSPTDCWTHKKIKLSLCLSN